MIKLAHIAPTVYLPTHAHTHTRPVVISIDDCSEYQADFVLATLLDAHNPTSSQAQTTSTPRPRQTESESSRAHRTTVMEHPSFVEDGEDDEGSRQVTEPKRTTGRGARTGDSDLPSNINIPFPSDSMNGTNVPSPPRLSSRVNFPEPSGAPSKINIPSPPDPLQCNDNEMLEAHGSGHDTADDCAISRTGWEGESDLTDALFEMENRTDVCEGGMFWGISRKVEGAQSKRIVGGGGSGGALGLLGCRRSGWEAEQAAGADDVSRGKDIARPQKVGVRIYG